jgi:hypothetical protein
MVERASLIFQVLELDECRSYCARVLSAVLVGYRNNRDKCIVAFVPRNRREPNNVLVEGYFLLGALYIKSSRETGKQ